MDYEFIYVYDETLKDELIKAGFYFIKADKIYNSDTHEVETLYIFKNSPDIKFNLNRRGVSFSNILTF